MPINFTQILQDCWNFIRNQRRFTCYFMLLFAGLLIAFQFVFDTVRPGVLNEVSAQLEAIRQSLPAELAQQLKVSDRNDSLLQMIAVITHPTMMTVSIVGQIVIGFITACGIISIDQISRQKTFDFSTALSAAIRRFSGALIINVLILLPLIYALVLAVLGAGIAALIVTAAGTYVFVRLCLTYIAYLTERKKLVEAVRFTWRKTQKGFGSLFIFCLLNYVTVIILNGKISAWADNSLLLFISIVCTAFLHLFSIIFSYRFYTLFMK